MHRFEDAHREENATAHLSTHPQSASTASYDQLAGRSLREFLNNDCNGLVSQYSRLFNCVCAACGKEAAQHWLQAQGQREELLYAIRGGSDPGPHRQQDYGASCQSRRWPRTGERLFPPRLDKDSTTNRATIKFWVPCQSRQHQHSFSALSAVDQLQ